MSLTLADQNEFVNKKSGVKGRLAPQGYSTYGERKRGKGDQSFNEKAFAKLSSIMFPPPSREDRSILNGLLETSKLQHMNIEMLAYVLNYMKQYKSDSYGYPPLDTQEFANIVGDISSKIQQAGTSFTSEELGEKEELIYYRIKTTFIRYIDFINSARWAYMQSQALMLGTSVPTTVPSQLY
jgi:hypothetical protein